ncbi:MAG TPA: hypothetical protein VFT47_21505 [Vicinamibacterales bacterium]|nr:hypothetical protein [Vicinamibacterales bacterium]
MPAVTPSALRGSAIVAAGDGIPRTFDGSRRFAGAITAVAMMAYAVLACLLTWPLPLNLRTQLLGNTGGDTGVYLWNLWIFRHEILRHAHVPFSTGDIFAYTGGADFSLHNYTPVAGLLGLGLIGPLGVVGAFNVVLIVSIASAGIAAFLLGRRVGLRPWPAWVCGALFAASPVLTAREPEHLSLVLAAPLPLFLSALLRTLETQRLRDAVLVGALVAVAFYSDAYYGVYCALMGSFVVAYRFTEWSSVTRTSAVVRATRGIDALLTLAAALVGWRLVHGPADVVVSGVHIQLQTLYNPLLVISGLATVRALLAWRPRIADPRRELPHLWRLGAAAVAVCAVLMLPVIVGLAARMIQGRLAAVETFWRSSPRGVDALAYFVPNPTHPVFGAWTRPLFLPPRSDAFPEFVASFSLVGLVVITAAGWRGRLPRAWVAFTAFFGLLSLGPFMHVAGVNTYVPGPWALLRYVPLVGMARSPSRFTIVVALGLSILFAFAIQELWRGRGSGAHLRGVLLGIVIGLELLPSPRTLHSAAVPRVYHLIRMDPAQPHDSAVLLELPTGLRDDASSVGNFNPASMYFQTTHDLPLIGGYLSRVSASRKRRKARDPMLAALITASEGRPLAPSVAAGARAARDPFLRRSCVRYVVLDTNRAPLGLRDVAVELLQLASVYREGAHELFTPLNPPPCGPR